MGIKLHYFYSWLITFKGKLDGFKKVRMSSTFYFSCERSFIFPFRVINPKPVPILNCVMAFIFCFYNGLLQGMYMTNVYTIEAKATTILGNFLLTNHCHYFQLNKFILSEQVL